MVQGSTNNSDKVVIGSHIVHDHVAQLIANLIVIELIQDNCGLVFA